MSVPNPDTIVYGGSFDPPHLGHLLCIEESLKNFPDSKLFIMVSPAPAVSDGEAKQVKTDKNHRLSMVRQLLHELPEELSQRIEIRTDEFDLPAPNYTIETLKHLQKRYPAQKFALLVGLDQWKNLSNWREAKRLCQSVSIVACDRKQSNEIHNYDELALALAEKLELGLEVVAENVWRISGTENYWSILSNRTIEVSSSEIRQRINEGQSATDLTVGSVLSYIDGKNLYQMR